MNATQSGANVAPSTINQRAQNLKSARIRAGYKSALAASNDKGWAQKTYCDHEGGRKNFGHLLEIYAAAFNVTQEQLTGAQPLPPVNEVPHLDFTSIRENLLAELIQSSGISTLSLYKCGPRAFTIANPDRAMTTEEAPKLLPNDMLAFDPDAPIRAGDYVLAQVEGRREPVFRIFYPSGKTGAQFKALNPRIEAIQCARLAQWKTIAKLMFIVRSVETLG